MGQIENVDLTKLHTDEVLGFLMQMAEKTSSVTVEADQGFITAFKTATAAFNDVMRPHTANSYTDARKAADAITDRYCVGIRMYAEAMTYSSDAVAQPIAEKVFKTIKSYGYLTQMGYKEQYPNLQALLSELKAMPTADIEALGLSKWITALDQAYNNFVSITADKVNEDATKQVGIVQESREAAQTAYYAMRTRLNAGAMYMGDAPYAAFIDTANVIVSEYKALIASRKTRAANKKDS